MNCCNDYGQCTQGPNCAARMSDAAGAQALRAPAKVAHSHPHTCAELGVCQGRSDCLSMAEQEAQVQLFKARIKAALMPCGSHLMKVYALLEVAVETCPDERFIEEAFSEVFNHFFGEM